MVFEPSSACHSRLVQDSCKRGSSRVSVFFYCLLTEKVPDPAPHTPAAGQVIEPDRFDPETVPVPLMLTAHAPVCISVKVMLVPDRVPLAEPEVPVLECQLPVRAAPT
jgi:hypothetical protein